MDKQIPDTQGGGALGPEVVSRLARGKRGGRSVRAVAERAPMPRAILNRPA
ncbi:MAG: hypothetical protein HZC37_13965 [Burkholderiales bacterium]|nr:hypothetical protein [Burkholderiales bacterium]